ncbi:MAG: hypothetical protein ACI3XD_01685 [Oscillospiraceae bacterium]
MYNRYQGNSGKVERIHDTPQTERRPQPAMVPVNRPKPPSAQAGGGLANTFQNLLQKFSLADLETEDLLLILILYLMYKESGDKELLFILGGLFLL